MAPRALERALEKLSGAASLDAVAKPLAKKVAKLIPHGVVKDTLSGTWLGHPLHPMLTDLPIGCWTNAMALDLLAGRRGEAGAQFLIGLGVLTALPTAVSGASDWSDTLGEERRVGFAHAAGNTVALACYGLSWVARKRGGHRRGVALGLLGGAVATGSAYLGGHLAWRRGVNVDRHAWAHPKDKWVDLGPVDDLPRTVTVGDDQVYVVRDGDSIRAISDVCAHMGGPLSEGRLEGGCVTCPWHQSVFRLEDGQVVHGPATGPQPVYDVRTEGGRVSAHPRR